jgi:hypothetical protein
MGSNQRSRSNPTGIQIFLAQFGSLKEVWQFAVRFFILAVKLESELLYTTEKVLENLSLYLF